MNGDGLCCLQKSLGYITKEEMCKSNVDTLESIYLSNFFHQMFHLVAMSSVLEMGNKTWIVCIDVSLDQFLLTGPKESNAKIGNMTSALKPK